MTTSDLLTVSEWKSRGRNLHLVRKNPESRVRDVTRLTLIAEDESARLDVPTLLHGVGHRVASVILHFCHADPYPILDSRALHSLGVDDAPDPCPFDFWWAYVQECRMLSAHGDLSMRELDRALWQYDQENP